MTSTSISVGLNEKKNSSRVLKPPGGGHSDIFGINEDTEIITPSKKKNVPSTSISSCFYQEEEIKKPNNNMEQINREENGNGNIDENTEPAEENKQEEMKKEPAKRVRVPPGGFSSGLW